MKKYLIILITLLQFPFVTITSSDYFPLAWEKWQLWRSPFGCLDLSKDNFLPYINKTAFFPVKGYNHCVMRVYEASIKFGELTRNDDYFIKFEIDYDEKGRVVKYRRKDKGTFGGVNYCEIERDGDCILSERYTNGNAQLIGQTIYKYDERNRLSVIDLIDKNNRIYKKTRYVYGNNGQVKRYEYNEEGEERCAAIDIKDAKGRLIKQTYMEGGSTIVETITYNENGLIKKINSSKTFVFNDHKDETFKGKLFDEYKYRYDPNGNVLERLTLQSHPFGQKYEWIKCEYSNVEEEVVEEVVQGDGVPNAPTNNLSSSNPNENCATMYFNILNNEHNPEGYHFVKSDMDNDGIEEYIYYAKKNESCALVIYGCKEINGKTYHNRYEIPLEEKTIDACTVSTMQHDFDNDGNNEVIIACLDMSSMIEGRVFRWVTPSTESSDCFLVAGQFGSCNIPYVDGNTIKTKAGWFGNNYKTFIYNNGKLSLSQ